MADYCFEVVISPSTHTIADPEKDAARWARGDIVEIYPAEQMGVRSGNIYTPNNPVGMPRTGWVFIRDVPDNIPAIGNITLEFLRKIFVNGWTDNTGRLLRKRNFTIDQVPNAFRIQMRDNRYATVSYANAKPYIWNKRYNRLLDELQDLANG